MWPPNIWYQSHDMRVYAINNFHLYLHDVPVRTWKPDTDNIYLSFLSFAGWVGFIRGCYSRGMLPGVNDSAGCRYWRGPNNLTALYCFCTTDYCNSGPPLKSNWTGFGWLFYLAHASVLFFTVHWIVSVRENC